MPEPEIMWTDKALGAAGKAYSEFGQFYQSFPSAAYQKAGRQIEAMGQAFTAIATASGAEFDQNEFQQDFANNIAAGMLRQLYHGKTDGENRDSI